MKLSMNGVKLVTTTKTRLKELYDRYDRDPKFDHLRADDINFVPGTGILNPTAMIIGEAPGATENARAIPFVGNAGVELTRLLKKAEIDIGELYLTNVVKYWTRTDDRRVRAPSDQEIEDSKSYLLEEIEIVNPYFIALCGRVPGKTIFPNLPSIRAVNGKLLGGKYIPLYHPAVILYNRTDYEMRKEVLRGYETLASLINTLER